MPPRRKTVTTSTASNESGKNDVLPKGPQANSEGSPVKSNRRSLRNRGSAQPSVSPSPVQVLEECRADATKVKKAPRKKSAPASQAMTNSATTKSKETEPTSRKRKNAEEKTQAAKRLKALNDEAHQHYTQIEEEDDAQVAMQQSRAMRRLSGILEVAESLSGNDSDQYEYFDIDNVSGGTTSDSAGSVEFGNLESPDSESDAEEDGTTPGVPGANSATKISDARKNRIQHLQAELAKLQAAKSVKRKKGASQPSSNTLGVATGLKLAFQANRKKATAAVNVTERGLSENDIDDDDDGPGAAGSVVQRQLDLNVEVNQHYGSRQNTDVMIVNSRDVNTNNQASVKVGFSQKQHGAPPSKTRSEAVAVSRRSTTPASSRIPQASGSGGGPVYRDLDHSKAAEKTKARPSSSKPPSSTSMTASKVRTGDLPDFTSSDNKWRRVFLPTLYLQLYTSLNPFTDFVLGLATLVATVQQAIDHVYTGITYKVKHTNDAVHYLAYNRIMERRSTIAAEAITLVSKKLKSFKKIDDARQWLLWARRVTCGPLFFEKPTPEYCSTWDPSDADFIQPSGRLSSSFITTLARSAFKHSKNGLSINDERPIGLFALIMTSLERAAKVLTATGDRADQVTDFSQTSWGGELKTYKDALKKVSEDKWIAILTLCEVEAIGPQKANENAPIFDTDRRNIFSFESPQKG